MHDEWIAQRVGIVGPGRIQPPTLVEACTWIAAAWESLSVELIKHSFVCCGISSSVDGSDDSQITCLQREEFQAYLENLNNR